MKYPQLVSMPSAISDWLEEQLEARGIDGVVYTRYVLSLLHSHTLDLICPDGEDLQYSYLKKEVRRAGGRNKRFCRSSSDWWKHAQADAEQIKRSAAVECLMSASDQNCEVESLIDELCAKLKGENSESNISPDKLKPQTYNTTPVKKVTPQELAEEYYAAFPSLPLQSKAELPELQQSKLLKLMEPKRKVGESPSRKRGLAGRRTDTEQYSRYKEETETTKRNQSRQRFPYFSRMRASTCRKIDWEPPAFRKQKSKSKSASEEHRRSLPKPDFGMHNNSLGETDFDQCLAMQQEAWCNNSENDHELNMYEDLQVDLRGLLDSPEPEDTTRGEFKMANIRDVGERQYIAYTADIKGSIWSADRDVCLDNTLNTSIDYPNFSTPSFINCFARAFDYTAPSESTLETTLEQSFSSAVDYPDAAEPSLNAKFGSICINGGERLSSNNYNVPSWPPLSPTAQNQVNDFFEMRESRAYRNSFLEGLSSLPGDLYSRANDDNSDNENLMADEELSKQYALSLSKLNHTKETSGFAEVVPRNRSKAKPYTPFSKPNGFGFASKPSVYLYDDKEDLLTSERTHFKPIVEEIDNNVKKQYADGATFLISNNLDKVEYRRSESGTLFLDHESGQSRKYYEYRSECSLPRTSSSSDPVRKFVIKFRVCENDKLCQTEESLPFDFPMMTEDDFEGNSDKVVDSSEAYVGEDLNCSFRSDSSFDAAGSSCSGRTSPDSILREIAWSYGRRCEDCNKNGDAAKNDSDIEDVPGDSSKKKDDIWNAGEFCQMCVNSNMRPTPSPSIHSLREDINQDGEQLFSDLNHLHNAYMEGLPETEISCNLVEFLNTSSSSSDKRRLSFVVAKDGNLSIGGPWTFSPNFEEDCRIQLSALPTLRSVTF